MAQSSELLIVCLLLVATVSSTHNSYGQHHNYQVHVVQGHDDDGGGHQHGQAGSSSDFSPPIFQSHLGGGASQGKSLLSAVAAFLPMLMSQRDDESASIPFNITDLLRMVGVDSSKIGTMVINAIVYVIELAENFLKRISDPDVPSTIIKNLQKVTGNDTVCIQQLICKMSPFWWGVNQSVRDLLPLGKMNKQKKQLPNIGWASLLKKYVPSVDEFSANSDLCETRFPGCVVVTYPKAAAAAPSPTGNHVPSSNDAH